MFDASLVFPASTNIQLHAGELEVLPQTTRLRCSRVQRDKRQTLLELHIVRLGFRPKHWLTHYQTDQKMRVQNIS